MRKTLSLGIFLMFGLMTGFAATAIPVIATPLATASAKHSTGTLVLKILPAVIEHTQPVAAKVTIIPTMNSGSVNTLVGYTVLLTGSYGGPVPTGSVTIYSDGVAQGVYTLGANGAVTCEATPTQAETVTLSAVYSGDSNYK